MKTGDSWGGRMINELFFLLICVDVIYAFTKEKIKLIGGKLNHDLEN